MEIVLLFPGQGSQKPGMGKELYELIPEARRVFDEVDEALGFAISELCFEGPADDLRRIEYGFRLCLSRNPSAGECSRLVELLRETDWPTVARVLLNLDETITRE